MGWLQAPLCSRSHRRPTSENPLVRVLNHKTRIWRVRKREENRIKERRRERRREEGRREEGRKRKRAVLFR